MLLEWTKIKRVSFLLNKLNFLEFRIKQKKNYRKWYGELLKLTLIKYLLIGILDMCMTVHTFVLYRYTTVPFWSDELSQCDKYHTYIYNNEKSAQKNIFKDKIKSEGNRTANLTFIKIRNTNTGAHEPCQRLLMLTYNQLQCRIPTQTRVFSITEINRMDHIYLLPADYPSAHLHVLYLCTHAATPSPFPACMFE